MEKLHERKMNDLYKSPNGKCLEKFEFVKAKKSATLPVKSME